VDADSACLQALAVALATTPSLGRQGGAIEWCAGGHLAWRSPAGGLLICSGSPGDWHAVHKLRADLRRHGLMRSRCSGR
jgi:hypothetical protein